MSRMKRLLRKLHIGGGPANDHHPHRRRPPPSHLPTPPPPPPTPPPPSPPAKAAAPESEPRLGGVGVSGGLTVFEEEYQVQLALAISASDPDGLVDPDSVQIKAAERISLGCGGGGSGGRSPMEMLSMRYWNYNIVNYDEKLMDGFYDVYGVISNPGLQGKLPSLIDLKAMPVTEDINCVAISVNRVLDPALQQLERRATAIALQSKAEHGIAAAATLVQKIADLVVDAMGGPVEDADGMLRKWSIKSQELCRSLHSIVLPLGLLKVGLSRHRSLLFKVLADQVNLPCKLVKGIYCTGTDEGAINLVKIDFDSTEYIVDLMGAPGTLIPSEISSSQFQNSTSNQLNSDIIQESVAELCLALEKVSSQSESKNEIFEGSSSGNTSVLGLVGSQLDDRPETYYLREHSINNAENYQIARPQEEYGKLCVPCDGVQVNTLNTGEDISPAQQMKVNDVPNYVASAAKNPEFAQKLHAVLLESGVTPLPDLFSDLNAPHNDHKKKGANSNTSSLGKDGNEQIELPDGRLASSFQPAPDLTNEWMVATSDGSVLNDFWSESTSPHLDNTITVRSLCWDQPVPSAPYGINLDQNKDPGNACSDVIQYFQANVETTVDNLDLHGHVCSSEDQGVAEDYVGNISGKDDKNLQMFICSSTNKINSIIDDVAEYEIPWEDLRVGERIGLGSYGEVYRADWHGTEVAVKKFLDQDFSGEALAQFKCEVKIMSRLRHPNVVLFMGFVTQPPNFSILTEYLPRGSLYRLLHRPNVQLDETRRVKMALDVARGMNYLHTSHPTIVHRDLKSPNLLVDKNWVLKVSDFGLSRLKHHTFLSSKSTAGTPEWMAPEVLRNEPSNEKCDVYSFGVILWELATMQKPWSGLNPMQVVGAVGFQNRRLDIPKEVDPVVASIISSCWESDPSKRPSFSQLLSPLKQLQRLVFSES